MNSPIFSGRIGGRNAERRRETHTGSSQAVNLNLLNSTDNDATIILPTNYHLTFAEGETGQVGDGSYLITDTGPIESDAAPAVQPLPERVSAFELTPKRPTFPRQLSDLALQATMTPPAADESTVAAHLRYATSANPDALTINDQRELRALLTLQDLNAAAQARLQQPHNSL